MEQTHFNTKEAVEYLRTIGLNFKPSTLEVWRSLGKGPRYKKVTRKVYYEKSALDEFSRGEIFETTDSINDYKSLPFATKQIKNTVRKIEKKFKKQRKPKRINLKIKDS